MRKRPQISTWFRRLDYAIITSTLTAFEVFVADLWCHVVNSHPDILVQNLLKAFDKDELPESITSRNIPLSVVAKYGYNLTNHMGDAVKSKFDFSSVPGICKAYSATFPNYKIIREMFDHSELSKLCLMRNVIVHRAGIIDEVYKSKSDSKQNIGEELEVSDTEIFVFWMMTKGVGELLTLHVDNALRPKEERFSTTPPQLPKK